MTPLLASFSPCGCRYEHVTSATPSLPIASALTALTIVPPVLAAPNAVYLRLHRRRRRHHHRGAKLLAPSSSLPLSHTATADGGTPSRTMGSHRASVLLDPAIWQVLQGVATVALATLLAPNLAASPADKYLASRGGMLG